MKSLLAPGALLVLAVAACARSSPEARRPEAEPEAAATTTTTDASAVQGARRARMDVTSAEGVPKERVRTLFGPTLESVSRCLPGSSGTIQLRITSKNGVLDVEPEQGVSLDPTARACVLAALRTVHMEETASNAGGPAVPPSGFTSHLTVSW